MTSPSERLNLKNPVYELYEQELLDLNREVAFHPDLQEILGQQPNRDIYILISEVASFCGVILEGDYTKPDILKLCVLLTDKLRERRTGITIVSSAPGIN